MSADCIFCKIANGTIPTNKIYEDEDILAFTDIKPVAPTHVIVIPKKHYDTLNHIKNHEMDIVSKIFSAIREVARLTKVADTGYRVIVNTNRMAGQEVFHLHFHILGGRQLNTMG